MFYEVRRNFHVYALLDTCPSAESNQRPLRAMQPAGVAQPFKFSQVLSVVLNKESRAERARPL